jgi:hypothetical protein
MGCFIQQAGSFSPAELSGQDGSRQLRRLERGLIGQQPRWPDVVQDGHPAPMTAAPGRSRRRALLRRTTASAGRAHRSAGSGQHRLFRPWERSWPARAATGQDPLPASRRHVSRGKPMPRLAADRDPGSRAVRRSVDARWAMRARVRHRADAAGHSPTAPSLRAVRPWIYCPMSRKDIASAACAHDRVCRHRHTALSRSSAIIACKQGVHLIQGSSIEHVRSTIARHITSRNKMTTGPRTPPALLTLTSLHL